MAGIKVKEARNLEMQIVFYAAQRWIQFSQVHMQCHSSLGDLEGWHVAISNDDEANRELREVAQMR